MDEAIDELRQIIKTLAYEWVKANLSTVTLTYSDYVDAITRLMLSATSVDRAIDIFGAVLDQAIALKRSCEWVAAELKFEVSAEVVGNRQAVLDLAIASEGAGNDASLDLYHNRLNRFKKDC